MSTQECFVELTEEAVAAARDLAAENPDWQGKPLRLYLDGKGCDGFSYGVSFDKRLDNDFSMSFKAVELVVDRDTAGFVHGSTIDWVDDERGRGFLVENPKHKRYRGKFFRAKNWRQKSGWVDHSD